MKYTKQAQDKLDALKKDKAMLDWWDRNQASKHPVYIWNREYSNIREALAAAMERSDKAPPL